MLLHKALVPLKSHVRLAHGPSSLDNLQSLPRAWDLAAAALTASIRLDRNPCFSRVVTPSMVVPAGDATLSFKIAGCVNGSAPFSWSTISAAPFIVWAAILRERALGNPAATPPSAIASNARNMYAGPDPETPVSASSWYSCTCTAIPYRYGSVWHETNDSCIRELSLHFLNAEACNHRVKYFRLIHQPRQFFHCHHHFLGFYGEYDGVACLSYFHRTSLRYIYAQFSENFPSVLVSIVHPHIFWRDAHGHNERSHYCLGHLPSSNKSNLDIFRRLQWFFACQRLNTWKLDFLPRLVPSKRHRFEFGAAISSFHSHHSLRCRASATRHGFADASTHLESPNGRACLDVHVAQSVVLGVCSTKCTRRFTSRSLVR
mmetsp:Transcript_10206/g.62263  ORF Transcript_10206/g.62263 Transcript_10206/m.62263 type:complete len:374 (+) Transcript_10206:1048-2169(+)